MRALIFPLLVALIVVSHSSTASAQGGLCDDLLTIVICEITVVSESGDGGTAMVTCDLTDGLPCLINDCDYAYIADDSGRWGVAWNGDPHTAPVPTSMLAFVDDAEADFYATTFVGGGAVGNYSETGSWWTCTNVDAELDPLDRLSAIGPGGVTYGPDQGLIDVVALREAARARAVPGMPPVQKSTRAGLASIAQAPTWFWIDSGWWRPYSVSQPSSTGRMVVTVNAEPVDSVWETGEGQLTDCEEGKVYQAGISDPDDPFGCIWIYEHSTGYAGGPYRAEVTVRTELDWTMTFNNGARFEQGNLPDYFSADGFDITVEELLAVASAGS